MRLKMKNEIGGIYRGVMGKPLYRPVFLVRVQAGFPSPAEDYIEGRIDFSRDLIKHPLSTFYIRVIGDSMEPLIHVNSLIVVDSVEEANSGDVVVACVNSEMCVKELSKGDDGRIWLLSKNDRYPPIEIRDDDNFEVWGTVIHVIHPLKGKDKVTWNHPEID